MLRTTALVVALAVLVASAAAASDAPQSIQITADSVTVRDLLLPGTATDGAGEEILETAVLTGLRPGEQRVLTPAEIYLRLAELGIEPGARGWSWPHAVTVTRRCQVISTADLIAAGEAGIRRELHLSPGDEATITPVMRPRPLLAAVGDIGLEATVTPPRLPGGLWAADVVGGSGVQAAICSTIRYRVRVTGSVLVTRSPVRRQQALTEMDVTAGRRDISNLRGDPLRNPEELVGRRASRAAAPGTVLTSDWIEPIPAVRRGDFITAIAQVGAVRASARVLALADGAVGDTIRVRVEGQKREFLVRVCALGRAEVVIAR